MRPVGLTAVTAAVLAACSDANNLPDPVFTNVEDTVTVFAISGTEVFQPSGYAMTERRAVRLDQSSSADIAFDITSDGRPVFLPGAMIGQPGTSGIDPGLQTTTQEYDDIALAIVNGYRTLDTVAVDSGQVYFLRSRIPGSCFLGVPTYGKVEILGLDPAARTVVFKVLANLNCGYKSLLPGTPSQ
ncbi:MAG TPA: hypothetical protein VGA78_05060 [Gemmatimonadales bacterium]